MEIRFSIRSSVHYIGFLRGLILSLKVKSNNSAFDHKAVVALQLVLVEAVNNAVFHAHGGKYDKWIDIFIGLDKKLISVEITDSGKGFDFAKPKEFRMDSSHGRGLLIIRSLMHEVDYVRGAKNTLKMKYYFETSKGVIPAKAGIQIF